MPADISIGDNYELDEDSNGDLVIKDATDTVVAKHTDGGGWDVSDITALSGESGSGVYDDGSQTVGDGDTTANHEAVSTGQINSEYRVNSDDDPQTIIDNAGVNTTVKFDGAQFTISSPLQPVSGQTWIVPHGIDLRPSGDNSVLDLTGVEDFVLLGGVFANDPNSNTTTEPAVLFSDCRRNLIQRIHASGFYNGFEFSAGTLGINENIIGSLYSRDTRNDGIQLGGETHDNHFGSVFLLGASGSNNGITWDTSGVDGGNIFNQVLSLDFDNDGMSVIGLNREFWISDGIFDKASATGVNLQAGGNRAAFFGSLWTSGCGNAGLRVSGDDTTNAGKVWDVQVGNLYAIGNGDKAANIEYSEGIQIANVIARNNTNGGVAFQTGQSDNCYIGSLTGGDSNDSPANGGPTLIGTQAGENVVVGNLNAPEGVSNIGNLSAVNGDPLPEDLTARSGDYEGERGYHDGTDGGNTNRAEPATWTGSDWEGEISGNIIT